MSSNRRAYLAVLLGVAGVLAAIVLYDVYADWILEGKPLELTLLENALPLLLLVGLAVALSQVRDRGDRFLSVVTTRTLAGVFGTLAIAGWVLGLQTLQGELKPLVAVTHIAIGGAVAGVLIGYNTAAVTEARSAAQQEKRRWESLFQNAPAEIADVSIAGDDHEIRAANDAFRERFDTDGEGVALYEVLPFDEATRAEITDRVQDGAVYTTRTTVEQSGDQRHYQVRFVPYTRDDQHRFYAVLTDVTDLKETQTELEETVDRLERSNERLQEFAYVASHDLQEPLRMVASYVDLLASEYEGQLDEEADEYIEYAVDGAERMQDMIDALLEYSRVKTQAEAFEAVDADAVLDEVLQDLEVLIAEYDATVERGDLPVVEADGDQLGQVLQNLLKNAIEHGGVADGPPTVSVTATDVGDAHRFSVGDDGPGIPPEQQSDVFEIFEHGGTEDSGTGIGLAVCERIVDRHDGDIWVESTEGEGATFHFTIPK